MQLPLGSPGCTHLLLWAHSRALKLSGIFVIICPRLLILEMKNIRLRKPECRSKVSQLVSSGVRISTLCLLPFSLKALCILWHPEETTFFQICQLVLNFVPKNISCNAV